MPNFSPLHRFSEWPNADVPVVAAGVYAIVETCGEAYSLEKQCREGMVFGVKPVLNPG